MVNEMTLPEDIKEPECKVCADWDQPCDSCASDIHQSWHAQGFWWIRTEMCDSSCPNIADTLRRRLQVIEVTARDKARDRQLRLDTALRSRS